MTAQPGDPQHDSSDQQQDRKSIDAAAQNRRHARHRARVIRDEGDERIIKCEHQQQTIECIVYRRKIVVLLFVQHHETVVLFDEVVVSPKRGDEEECEAGTGENHCRTHDKEKKRPEQQTLTRLPFGSIEVSTREGAKDVRRIDQNRPSRDHRNQRQDSSHIQNQQRITRRDRTDEPNRVFARVDDPAQRNGARADLIFDSLSGRGHMISGYSCGERFSSSR